MNEERKYLVNRIPMTFKDLIHEAEEYDEDFANDWLKSTSEAAKILRQNGISVTEA